VFGPRGQAVDGVGRHDDNATAPQGFDRGPRTVVIGEHEWGSVTA
jgi:hypothetical protein